MKRLLVLVTGALGLGAILQRRRGRPLDQLGPDPAGALRAKLAQSKSAGEDQEPAVTDEPPSGPESKRQDVHERARAAIDELR